MNTLVQCNMCRWQGRPKTAYQCDMCGNITNTYGQGKYVGETVYMNVIGGGTAEILTSIKRMEDYKI